MQPDNKTLQDLVNSVEVDLKIFIDTYKITNNSAEMLDSELTSIKSNWLKNFSDKIFRSHKSIIGEYAKNDQVFLGVAIGKLYAIKESLSLNCVNKLNKVHGACVDYVVFFINFNNIDLIGTRLRSLELNRNEINNRMEAKIKSELMQNELFNFYIKNIDVLVMLENIFIKINDKLSPDGFEDEFEKKLKEKLKEILVVLDESFKILFVIDLTNFDIIDNFSIDLDEDFDCEIEELSRNEKLLDFIKNILQIIESNKSSIKVESYQDDSFYLKALRLYELERKVLYKNIEIDELKFNFNNLSIIDEAITDKNEFYNSRVEKLLEVESHFKIVLKYYNELDKDNFSAKDWSEVESVHNNLKSIIDYFEIKRIYQKLLLLDDKYIDDLLVYLKDKKLDGSMVCWEDDLSKKMINDFYIKMDDPDSFIELRNRKWNTPLFMFNANYYSLIKDFKSKCHKIESLDKDLAEYIKNNGDYKEKYNGYIKDIENKKNEARKSVSNIVCQYNQVASLLNSVEKSEGFIREIEGLYINNETRKIYEGVFNDEAKVANIFRNVALIIYALLGVFAFVSLTILIIGEPDSEFLKRVSDPQTLFIKIPFILTLLFIGVYLSREGEKHRRFANQARQTMNELHAFSSYSTDIKEKVSEIKTKLADKYFGVNLYETEKAMTPDSDVFKTLVEQTKATTDLVKTLKSSITPTVPESKDKKENEDG